MVIRINLGLTVDVETNNLEHDNLKEQIFESMKGKGDERLGTNMYANIGYYVANKLEENLHNQGLDYNIYAHSVHIKEER
tara:strand:- start:994 stop:1233 length:240 start_codon:yes stop_codon:yes gene_type:complete